MLMIRTLIVVIMLSLTINVSAMAQEIGATETGVATSSSSTSGQSEETKESRKKAIKKEIQKRSEIEQRRVERFKALPEDIKIKIKDRKMAILESRKEIRSMKPENRAELQAVIQKWFASLPLEKQSEIQIRIEGKSSLREYKAQLREREAREIIAKEKAETARKLAEEKAKEKADAAKKATETKVKAADPKAKANVVAPKAPSAPVAPAKAVKPVVVTPVPAVKTEEKK